MIYHRPPIGRVSNFSGKLFCGELRAQELHARGSRRLLASPGTEMHWGRPSTFRTSTEEPRFGVQTPFDSAPGRWPPCGETPAETGSWWLELNRSFCGWRLMGTHAKAQTNCTPCCTSSRICLKWASCTCQRATRASMVCTSMRSFVRAFWRCARSIRSWTVATS